MLKAILCFIILFALTACGNINTIDSPLPVIVTEKNDNNQTNYLDDITFLGESTTYHLKSRGVLSGGKNTLQVWGPKSGTLMLDPTIDDCRIIYPETNQEISFEFLPLI